MAAEYRIKISLYPGYLFSQHCTVGVWRGQAAICNTLLEVQISYIIFFSFFLLKAYWRLFSLWQIWREVRYVCLAPWLGHCAGQARVRWGPAGGCRSIGAVSGTSHRRVFPDQITELDMFTKLSVYLTRPNIARCWCLVSSQDAPHQT